VAILPASDEVSIVIEGQNYRFWTDVELTFTLDGHSSVTFTAPFDPEKSEIRELFRPFSYKEVKVLLGGVVAFTGTMIGIVPEVTPDEVTVSVSCYSKAAVLQDVHFPADSYPLELRGLTLLQIAQKLCEPFGLTARIDSGGLIGALTGGTGPDGAAFDKVALKPEDKVQAFLADLAKQRGFVMGSGQDGNVVFRKSAAGPGLPVALISDKKQPTFAAKPNFEPQQYFSEVTCVAKTKRGKGGATYTESNFFLEGTNVRRPTVIELDDTDPGDIVTATQARIGRMFGNAASYDVDLATWFDPLGSVWAPDSRVVLHAPTAMIYSPYEFLVRMVKLKKDREQKRTASLNLVLPGIFSGELPESQPWDG
jgi:prophage tail gpP-like protein